MCTSASSWLCQSLKFISWESGFGRFDHVEKEIWHACLPFEHWIWPITSVHRPVFNQLVSFVQQKTSKCFSLVQVLDSPGVPIQWEEDISIATDAMANANSLQQASLPHNGSCLFCSLQKLLILENLDKRVYQETKQCINWVEQWRV